MSNTTKKALEVSLKRLMLQKPFEKITINDLTKDCGISRMTFYNHFRDIYDLVEWSCEEDGKQALRDNKTYDTWQEGLLLIFEAVLANKPFILSVYRSVSREQIETGKRCDARGKAFYCGDIQIQLCGNHVRLGEAGDEGTPRSACG